MSPGGALLRSSRVFAIPQALPRPASDLSSSAAIGSDTQTLPHPIHATITTPQSSLKRGDWGFKRPLPLRSTTRTSTPFIRVEAIDTIEHVTDYGSAADHTINLQKWHEMGVPISTPTTKKSTSYLQSSAAQNPKSVFEEELDQIAPIEGGAAKHTDQGVRWKFAGPWIAGQTEGEFNQYLQKTVRKRKPEFQKFLRAACAESISKQAQRKAREQGEESGPVTKAEDITEEQLQKYIISLRADRTELNSQIRKFLDMPPPPTADMNKEFFLSDDWLSGMSNGGKSDLVVEKTDNASPYANSGPPKTHPSAGLSYLRTAAHTFNHPMYGPQASHTPVQARVVMPKGASTGSFAPALGVGGFVTDLPSGSDSFDVKGQRRGRKESPLVKGLFNIEPEKVGGSKAYVKPTTASVNSKGQVVLTVDAADPEAVSVYKGTVDEIPTLSVPQYRPQPFSKPVATSDEGFGLKGFAESGALEQGALANSGSLKELGKLLSMDDKN
ncbi:hypothetical protein BP5796_05323 [Coleophoma crateriformis]|uniref:Uncharacterized protein n=1 Tax=Coleophoma crateriformis TaxID=565419 RepID=A0A3D8S2W9_9HELO|nr:hypothetical protein BP5796_05323 [Coleophoma crateriformis]